ncbi:MAG TPA: YwiC-like family protein [Terriglobia bacterium]|nr:YwiC-like family protein [Terriglobia bacterium]
MASATPILPLLTRSRGRSFILPREHGAWGMLLVPLVTGAAAGNPRGERIIWILLFAATALGLFCLRTPVEAWLEISPLRPQNDAERKLIYYSIYSYASVAGLALAVLILWVHAYGLLLLGAVAAIAFFLQAVLKRLGRETRMNAQLTGAIALSSTAAGAYYLATGHFGSAAVIIWLANWLFAANQIHFVQLRIHSARALTVRGKLHQGRGFLFHQAFSLLLLGLIWRAGWLPGLILVAFGPLFARGFAWFLESPQPLQVRRLGVSELLYAIVFGIFFIAGYHPQIG